MSTFDIENKEGSVTSDDYVQWEINFNLNRYQASVEPNNVQHNGEADDESLNPNDSTTTSPTNQYSVEVLDFTVESRNGANYDQSTNIIFSQYNDYKNRNTENITFGIYLPM